MTDWLYVCSASQHQSSERTNNNEINPRSLLVVFFFSVFYHFMATVAAMSDSRETERCCVRVGLLFIMRESTESNKIQTTTSYRQHNVNFRPTNLPPRYDNNFISRSLGWEIIVETILAPMCVCVLFSLILVEQSARRRPRQGERTRFIK